MGMLREAPQRAGSAAHRYAMASPARCTIRTAIPACRTGSEVPQPRAPRSLRPNRIGAVGAGGAESSFDARRAAPLLLAQVAAPHALQRFWHGCTGCASLSSVCQRNGCAMGCDEVLRKQAAESSRRRRFFGRCSGCAGESMLRHNKGLGNRSSKRGCENVEKPAGGWRKDAEKRAKKIKDGAVSGSWVPGGADG